MELEDLKKPLWAFLIFCGLAWYVNTHYTFRDVLKFAKEKPHPEYSPMLAYYAGMAQYARDDYDGAIEAFQQLLADYPTCQYAPSAMHRLGTSYSERRNYAAAREIWEKYFEEYPKDRSRATVEKQYEFIKFK